MGIHGGDIYGKHIAIDFSVNINPLGMPGAVEKSLHRAVAESCRYPDMEARKLREAVGRSLAVPVEHLLFGNGASELFMAVAHSLRPRKTVIPVPSFYGYEYAAKAAESEIFYYGLQDSKEKIAARENGKAGISLSGVGTEDPSRFGEELCRVLTEDVDLLFLANPNNPTGTLLEKKTLRAILRHCQTKGIYVVLDESFIEFADSGFSMLSETEEFDRLILVRTYTKIFAIPGVRLGYLVCKNRSFLAKTAAQLPEWNLSCFAQAAGCACAAETAFIKRTKKYIDGERAFLTEELLTRGFLVFPSAANFLLLYREDAPGKDSVYERLLESGILIRDCRNFKGLGAGFYRVAVKSRRENERLLQALEQCGRDG